MKIRAIITGATGMVGEGVLIECLKHPDVDQVLIINRKPAGYSHPKLKEIVHADFFKLAPIEQQFEGYNACFFCLGISSVGVKEPEYTKVTYDLTLNFARTVFKYSPQLIFEYVSGMGTDSSEEGRSMWARVKGKTENDLMKIGFPKVYGIRPGFMKPMKGMKYALGAYRYLDWMFPAIRKFFPGHVSTLEQVAKGMINAAKHSQTKAVLEVTDLVELSKIS